MVPEDLLVVQALASGRTYVRDRDGERPLEPGTAPGREAEVFLPLDGPQGERGLVRLDGRRFAEIDDARALPVIRSLLAMAVVNRFPAAQAVSEEEFGELTSETRLALADLVGDHPVVKDIRGMFREGAFPRFLFLTGEAGCGKRYLAQMAARRSHRRALVIHLIGRGLTGPWADLLPDVPEGFSLPRSCVVVVSDIETLPGPIASFLYRIAVEHDGDGAPALIGIGRDLPSEGVFAAGASWWEGRGRAFCLPPLRERALDMRNLTDYFLHRLSQEEGRPRSMAPEALDRLRDYPWPGNIRELRNCIERMVIQSASVRLGEESLPPFLQPGSREALLPQLVQARIGEILDLLDPTLSTSQNILGDIIRSVERLVVAHGLRRCGGSQIKTARFLGISRNTLHEKMRSFGLLKERRARNGAVAAKAAPPPKKPRPSRTIAPARRTGKAPSKQGG